MGRIFRCYKRLTAAVLVSALTICTLTGCRYSSVDDYLEDLGLKEAENSSESGNSADSTYDLAEDSTTGSSLYVADNADASSDYSIASSDASSTTDNAIESKPSDSQYSSYYTSDTNGDDERQQAREAIGLSDDDIVKIKKSQEGLYAYERLTDEGKTLYVELLTIMQNLASDIVVSTTSDEAIELVFDHVMADHPEIFYVDGYQYTNYTIDDIIQRISFTGNYIYSQEEVASRQTRINEAVNRCLANAPSSDDDYYAIKYVYDYIIENTEYSLEAEDNQNICSVFLEGRSVCNGYAKAAQLLLNKMGIASTLVTGTVDTKSSRGVRHAWNLVKCNDAYYYMDVTWGDSSYQTTTGESADVTKLPSVNYDYLCVTTESLCTNHTISDIIDMPNCTSMTDNYYVREDEYFVSAEMSLIKDLFDRRYNDGSDNVTMKCATQEVYDSIFDQLITNRGVFELLQGDNSTVSYTTFAETRTIIFWLQ